MNKLTSLAAALALTFTGVAQGAVIINFDQVGNDVVASYSGTIDTTGFGSDFNFAVGTSNYNIDPSSGSFRHYGPHPSNTISIFSGAVTSFQSYGTGGASAQADSQTGDPFGIYPNDDLLIPINYSGGTLSGSMTWLNTDFTDLGLTVGSVQHTLVSNDTVAINVNPVPEPGTAAMLLGGLSLLALRRRR